MSDDYSKTVRIKRDSLVAPDDRGRNVWVGKVESVELELVSTTALEKIFKTGDGKVQSEIRQLAKSKKDGVLARDTATGHFHIVSQEDLKTAVEVTAPRDGPKRSAEVRAAPISDKTMQAAAELSLVSTQILRKVVKEDAEAEAVKVAGKRDKFGGFNPYDNG